MSSPLPTQGKDPFDTPLRLDYDLPYLWRTGEAFSTRSPRMNMRYHRHGNLLLRASIGSNNLEGALRTIETAESHLSKLHALGMHIVSHLSEVHENPEAGSNSFDFIVISASKYITQSRPLNKPRARQYVSRSLLRDQLFKPLGNYLEWADSDLPKYILDEVYNPDQYSWQESSNTVFLHDIDPIMVKNSPGLPDEMCKEAIRRFKKIAPAVALYF